MLLGSLDMTHHSESLFFFLFNIYFLVVGGGHNIFISFLCGAEDPAQCLTRGRQALLCHRAPAPAPGKFHLTGTKDPRPNCV